MISILNKTRELKVSQPYSVPVNTTVNPTIAAANLLSVMPDISQGDGEFNRDGNQIMLKKIVVRGYYKQTFSVLDNNDTRATVRHMLLKQRNAESAASVINNPAVFQANTFLENAQPYSGNIEAFNTPLNANAFISRKQMRKVMTCPQSLGNQDAGNLDNSYWMFSYTITFGKGKKLFYPTGGALQPSNFPYFIAHGASALGSNLPMTANSVVYNHTATAYFFDS
uniref:hypothetical protein n=1 Tax=Polynucleobacter sp. TaxID=2029855 RepID=UPI00404766E6